MLRSRRGLLRLSGAVLATALAGCKEGDPETSPTEDDVEKIDDWQYDQVTDRETTASGATGAPQAAPASSKDVGLATGGAKGISNFRDNIDEGYLPVPTDLSYEGLFYEYYFDTGEGGCDGTFCPRYSTAVTADPLSGTTERYLRVGLDSGLSSVDRYPLNLVVVLDISGSMSSEFDEYYYDRHGNRKEVTDHSGRAKMDVAADVVAEVTTHLRGDDRFGMVVFNSDAAVAKPVRDVGRTDMEAIRGHIRDLEAGGGTDISAGIEEATALLSEYDHQDRTERETRTIVVTDAMPNTGETDDGSLQSTLADNADAHHYTTFVGVGVDFNTELVDAITSVEGANYLSVHSAEEFSRRLDEQFSYLVTPLVFDLSVSLDALDAEFVKVYGTTAAEEATGELLRANTLFPSPTREGEARGGVVLVQLDGGGDATLEAEWEARDGRRYTATADVTFPNTGPEQFDGTAVRKAVLLSRYADLLRNWMVYERDRSRVDADDGIDAAPADDELGEWERQSDDLIVSGTYHDRFGRFAEHFEAEMAAVGDDALTQELEVLRALEEYDA